MIFILGIGAHLVSSLESKTLLGDGRQSRTPFDSTVVHTCSEMPSDRQCFPARGRILLSQKQGEHEVGMVDLDGKARMSAPSIRDITPCLARTEPHRS